MCYLKAIRIFHLQKIWWAFNISDNLIYTKWLKPIVAENNNQFQFWWRMHCPRISNIKKIRIPTLVKIVFKVRIFVPTSSLQEYTILSFQSHMNTQLHLLLPNSFHLGQSQVSMFTWRDGATQKIPLNLKKVQGNFEIIFLTDRSAAFSMLRSCNNMGGWRWLYILDILLVFREFKKSGGASIWQKRTMTV